MPPTDPVANARQYFFAYRPEHLRPAILDHLHDPDSPLADWHLWPFAHWATVSAGFAFPRALVRFVLDTPPGWLCFLHAWGRCVSRCR